MPSLAQTFEAVPVDRLKPHPENARRGDLEAITTSISSNGFFGACVVQRSTGHILVGNHRWAAAQEAGESTVPVLWVDVDDDRARRIMLADNRTAELAFWDNGALLESLDRLAKSEGGLLGTGYSEADHENLMLRFGEPPTLDELNDKYGEPDAQSLWPVLRISVPPEVMTRWKGWREQLGTDDDTEAFVQLLDLGEREHAA